jgi:hypothetical protein
VRVNVVKFDSLGSSLKKIENMSLSVDRLRGGRICDRK